jgi:hypothetical protein
MHREFSDDRSPYDEDRQVKRCALSIFVVAAIAALAPAVECQTDDRPVPTANEIVMSPGSVITEVSPLGTISITAGRGLKRCYTWEEATRCVEMEPRDERWYGSLGLYFPGPGDHWEEHNGITRGVTEEGQQHFKTMNEALDWLKSKETPSLIYRNDGLAVGWGKVLPRKQLNVAVWQIFIDGRKPSQMPGAQDDRITVETEKPGTE